MTVFTNSTSGPKGVHTTSGLVLIDAGKTSDDLEVSEGELKSAKATGWFTIEGEVKALADMTLPELKKIAKAEEVDLGDAKEKADIIAAIELARESKAGA